MWYLCKICIFYCYNVSINQAQILKERNLKKKKKIFLIKVLWLYIKNKIHLKCAKENIENLLNNSIKSTKDSIV